MRRTGSFGVRSGRFQRACRVEPFLLGRGQANKERARALDISEGTVKIHLAAIFRLLDVRNRTEAVLKASALDLEPWPES